MSIVCKNCGTVNKDEALYCKECGKKILLSTKDTSTNGNTNTAKSEKNYGIFFWLGLFAFFGLMTYVIVNFKPDLSSQYDGKYKLKIDTYPKHSIIKIQNVEYSSSHDIYLTPGNYDVEVSHTGYKSEYKTLTLKDNTQEFIKLKRDGNQFSLHVTTIPSNAQVRILNIASKFYQGILLNTGKYLIEVSQEGFDKKTKWIDLKDDYQATIELSKKAFTSKLLSFEELKWCIEEQTKNETLKNSIDISQFSVNTYNDNEVNQYNQKINNLNKRNDAWNTRCQYKEYNKNDYNRIKNGY